MTCCMYGVCMCMADLYTSLQTKLVQVKLVCKQWTFVYNMKLSFQRSVGDIRQVLMLYYKFGVWCMYVYHTLSYWQTNFVYIAQPFTITKILINKVSLTRAKVEGFSWVACSGCLIEQPNFNLYATFHPTLQLLHSHFDTSCWRQHLNLEQKGYSVT